MSVLLSTKTKILEERLKLYLTSLQQRVQRGEITSTVEFTYLLQEALQETYLSMGKPTFKIRPAQGAPISEDYNKMMEEVINDLSMLYTELGEIARAIVTEFKNIEIQRDNIQGKIKSLANRVSTISTKAKESSSLVEVFKETFANSDNYDLGMVKDIPAEVNRRAGVLTLAVEDSATLEDIEISVKDSNGLPGNTHQVRAAGGRYKFYGEDGLHINLAEILDGNVDTWFEVEQFSITDTVREQVFGLGLDYIEGISWVDGGDLYIELVLTSPQPQPINWISIVPFIPADKGAAPPLIEHIILDDGKGSKVTIGKDQVLSSDTVFLVPRQKVKYAILRFKQSQGYQVLAGHWVFMEPGEKKGNQFSSIEEDKPRVPGPMPSVENLGVKYNPRTRGVDWPTYTKETVFDEARIKNNLFDITSQNLEVYLEAIKAIRYQIGLREVLLASYRFKESSEYISKPWRTKRPISEITIDVNAQIPEEFGPGEWLEFYISIDDATTWHRIYPLSAIGIDVKKKYLINTNTPLEARLDNIGYIDTNEEVREVRVKINLKRPGVNQLNDADFYTPLIVEYNLKIASRSE